MALNTDGFKTQLKGVYNNTLATTGNADAALDVFLEAFTQAVEAYLHTAQVKYISGLQAGPYPVTVTGTLNASIL